MAGLVYVASVVGHPDKCKIGFTTGCINKRIKQINQEYDDYTFELYKVYESVSPRYSESSAHAVLYNNRVERKIFFATPIEGCIAVLRGLDKRFSAINIDDVDYAYSYVVNNLDVNEAKDIDKWLLLDLVNLCCEVYGFFGDDCIYDVKARHIRKAIENTGALL